MRQKDGRYACSYCAEVLEIEHDVVPTVLFHATSGQPEVHIITVDGLEVHRCEVIDVTNASWHVDDIDAQTTVA